MDLFELLLEAEQEDPPFIYESGATFRVVNDAILSMENDSRHHPRQYMDVHQLKAAAKLSAMVDIEIDSKEMDELVKLWTEGVDSFISDARFHGYDPYSGIEVTHVKTALEALVSEGNRIVLPKSIRFSRETYTKVKDLMKKAEGTYKRNGFDFAEDVDTEDVLQRLRKGEVINTKKELQQFYTPRDLALRVQDLAGDIYPGSLILEPSAGRGALLEGLDKDLIHCCELDERNRQYLTEQGYTLVGKDFMEFETDQLYDLILANPPFTKNQDIMHVRKMYELLADDGVLVSVMSIGWQQNSMKKQTTFREWISEIEADVIDIPAGMFKESGTTVSTCIVKIRKQ
jgi:hypothetical protein